VSALPLTAQDVRAAAASLHGVAMATPALTSAALREATGYRVFCKTESLQLSGSFKFRGAYHHASSLPEDQLARGVIGASSGNHAHALALAARLLGIPATVVIPDDAPAVKVEGINALGARIVTYQRRDQDRDALVNELAQERGLSVIPSANSLHVMAGAGTAALELLTGHPDIATLVVPLGGGGLAAGSAVIAHDLHPGIRVIGVEPLTGADTQLSLRAGRRVRLPAVPVTIADGLGHTTPAELPWQVNSQLLDEVVTVTDDEIREAMVFAFRHLKIVAEPSGAVALAAVLSGRIPPPHDTTGLVISGGGVDLARFQTLAAPFPEQRSHAHA